MPEPRVAILAGGVGGAKMAHGFQQVLAAGSLTVIVNVADDCELFGLHISPDLDTVMLHARGDRGPRNRLGHQRRHAPRVGDDRRAGRRDVVQDR